jgi:ATP-binding cassette subfamily F protein 3
MLYQIKGGRVMFAADTILERVDFEVRNRNEKIAVVGRNGAGKTTLLKVITGEVELTKVDGEDSSITSTNPTIGYLRQITFDDLSVTLDTEIRKVFADIIKEKERIDELVTLMDNAEGDEAERLAREYTALMDDFKDRGGYYYEKEYDAMLTSFGFTLSDKEKKLAEFSGGQLTKLAFIKLLLSKPDILLLDEPTNHLDMRTIEWLEGYLQNYNCALVIVSHDRMFIDRIANVVYEITYGQVTRFSGNYSDYVRQKKERYEKQLKDHIAQQKEIKRLTELVERFKNKPSKVAMTRSKLKQIEHMELVARPADYDTKSFQAEFTPKLETGKDLLFAKDLVIGYDRPLATVNLDIKRGERLGIVGDNGIGKSTLLKTLVGDIKPLSGDFRFGVNVQIGYFDQRMAQYTSDKTVIDDYHDTYPDLTQTQVRNQLGAFLFTQDEVYKEVSALSGGERVRLCLAKIFHTKPNVLILDEPTNHMDMIGKETLEAMLASFPGTVIFVSHDRYFVKKVATQILDMRVDGVMLYPFGYEDYESRERPAPFRTTGPATTTEPSMGITTSQAERLAGKEADRRKRQKKKLEDKIESIEKEIEELKEELCKPEYASMYSKLTEIQNEIDAKEEELLNVMEEWDNS